MLVATYVRIFLTLAPAPEPLSSSHRFDRRNLTFGIIIPLSRTD